MYTGVGYCYGFSSLLQVGWFTQVVRESDEVPLPAKYMRRRPLEHVQINRDTEVSGMFIRSGQWSESRRVSIEAQRPSNDVGSRYWKSRLRSRVRQSVQGQGPVTMSIVGPKDIRYVMVRR